MKKTDKGNINLNIGVSRKRKLERTAEIQEQSMTTVIQSCIDKLPKPKKESI